MNKIYENRDYYTDFLAALNIYANGRLIGQSAISIKTLWGLVAPQP
jgi:hypothetical protein